MPRRVMKIDHVHDWDADRVQWAMIVGYVLIEIGEIIAQLQRVGRSKNVARDLCGRIWCKGDIQRAIDDHVENKAASQRFGGTVLTKLVRTVTASVAQHGG